MEAPLGVAVGNAVETREALDVLLGGGPPDLVECTLRLGAEMLRLAGRADGDAQALASLKEAISTGRAARTAERMIEAQGGDPRVVTDLARLPIAEDEIVVVSPRDGYVTRVDALAIGLASVAMGAGRTRADQAVDHAVGIFIDRKPGAKVARDEPLARLRVRHRSSSQDVVERVQAAFSIGETPPAPRPLVLDRLDASST
jgi:pyrimidine-nucleoside phosphorylase